MAPAEAKIEQVVQEDAVRDEVVVLTAQALGIVDDIVGLPAKWLTCSSLSKK